MVTRWGFSDELGTVMYGENQEEVFLGYSMGRQQNISESTSQKIDSEVRRLVEAGQAEARRIITERRADLEKLARGLLEYETLTGDEILGLIERNRAGAGIAGRHAGQPAPFARARRRQIQLDRTGRRPRPRSRPASLRHGRHSRRAR